MQKVYELSGQDPTNVVKALSAPKWTIRDARHLEDCMLYHAVAARVAGEGDDLTRVRRLFDWLVRNVQLVPAESLAVPGRRQAQARPADVLFRGMATENGIWSERGWLFMSLCRQIGVDVGILTYSPRRSSAMASALNTAGPHGHPLDRGRTRGRQALPVRPPDRPGDPQRGRVGRGHAARCDRCSRDPRTARPPR